jgi:transposase
MHYLGFDVAKKKVDGVLMSKAFQIKERFCITNEVSALSTLILKLKKDYPHLTIGAESTGICHLPVLHACEELNLDCTILNPLLTKQILQSSIRKRKTDIDDSVRIAKLLMQNEGRVMTYQEATDKSKVLVRSALKLGEMNQALRLHIKHVEAILDQVPEPLLKEEASMKENLKTLKKEAIKSVPKESRKLLESIPGVGAWLASTMLAEIGDIKRFDSGDALIAYAGLDPQIKQSGANLNTHGKITKRGSKHLRRALTCAAGIAKMHDPELKKYYTDKRSEGRKYREVLCILGRKVGFRVFAVLKRCTPYEKRETKEEQK